MITTCQCQTLKIHSRPFGIVQFTYKAMAIGVENTFNKVYVSYSLAATPANACNPACDSKQGAWMQDQAQACWCKQMQIRRQSDQISSYLETNRHFAHFFHNPN